MLTPWLVLDGVHRPRNEVLHVFDVDGAEMTRAEVVDDDLRVELPSTALSHVLVDENDDGVCSDGEVNLSIFLAFDLDAGELQFRHQDTAAALPACQRDE